MSGSGPTPNGTVVDDRRGWRVDDSYGPLQVRTEPGLAVVTIENPPSNLVDGVFVMGLLALLDALDERPGIRAVVFRSADPDFFLMHGDVNALLQIPRSTHQQVDAPNIAAAAFERLSAGPYVSIGAIDGAARGGGCEFLSALDIRYGSPRTVIGQPEVPMGILPGAGGTSRLPRLIGRDHALELILTGRDCDADEALALGWLTTIVPSDEVDEYALTVARRVARMPAASVAAVKRVVGATIADLVPALVTETNELGELTAAGAQQEPMRRFLDAGGQTRDGETQRMAEIVDAMLAD
jgi:enoyl-CoA hydratase/carnithine racemase